MNQTMRNLLVAGTLFIVGLLLVTSYISGQNAKIEKGNDYIRVLVAKKDIPSGTKAATLLDGGYVSEEKILRRDGAPQVIHNIKDVEKLSLRQNVYQGEQLTAFKFETTSALNPGDQIRGTERIVSVHLMPTGTVAHLVKPGDHVDLMASGEIKLIDPKIQKALGITATEAHTGTWVVARNVLVLQTPDSLVATDAAAQKGPDPTAASAKGDEKLWTLQVSDDVVQNILYSQASANDDGIQMVLRPSTAAQETKLPPELAIPNAT